MKTQMFLAGYMAKEAAPGDDGRTHTPRDTSVAPPVPAPAPAPAPVKPVAAPAVTAAKQPARPPLNSSVRRISTAGSLPQNLLRYYSGREPANTNYDWSTLKQNYWPGYGPAMDSRLPVKPAVAIPAAASAPAPVVPAVRGPRYAMPAPGSYDEQVTNEVQARNAVADPSGMINRAFSPDSRINQLRQNLVNAGRTARHTLWNVIPGTTSTNPNLPSTGQTYSAEDLRQLKLARELREQKANTKKLFQRSKPVGTPTVIPSSPQPASSLIASKGNAVPLGTSQKSLDAAPQLPPPSSSVASVPSAGNRQPDAEGLSTDLAATLRKAVDVSEPLKRSKDNAAYQQAVDREIGQRNQQWMPKTPDQIMRNKRSIAQRKIDASEQKRTDNRQYQADVSNELLRRMAQTASANQMKRSTPDTSPATVMQTPEENLAYNGKVNDVIRDRQRAAQKSPGEDPAPTGPSMGSQLFKQKLNQSWDETRPDFLGEKLRKARQQKEPPTWLPERLEPTYAGG